MSMNKVERMLMNCLTAGDIIDELSGYDRDAKVVFGCDYGDRCHTEQALPVLHVDELCETELLQDSGYSSSGVAIVNDEAMEGVVQHVIVLRYSRPEG